MKKQFIINSQSGMALVTVTIFTFVLLVLGTTFLTLATSERVLTSEEVQRAQAFYLAEAGIEKAIAFMKVAGNEYFVGAINENFGDGSYSVTVSDDLLRAVKIIASTGIFQGEQKTITVEVQLVPAFFRNTFTSPGDLLFFGIFAAAHAHGTTWLSGEYDPSGWFLDMQFDELVEGVDPNQTTLRFPDMNGNSIVNEFSDFVLFFQNEVQQLDPSEVIWIQTDGTVDIWPRRDYTGKKIIFVEGSAPGTGNVNIWFDSGSWWESGQDVTVVSTGGVTYIQPLQNPSDNRLSVICWDDFIEGAILYSAHRSVIGTQGTADFYYLLSLTQVTGSIFANEQIEIQEAVVLVDFYHDDTLNHGNIPPGLRPLCTNNYFLGDIVSWAEG